MDKQWRDATTKAVLYPTEVKTSLLNIDSRFRDKPQSTSSSDFLIRLPRTYKNVITLRMSSIELPNTWYTFSKEHKTTSFYVNDIYIEIPDGNYTVDGGVSGSVFTDIVQEALNTAITGESFTVFLDPVSSKIVIENDGGNDFTMDFGNDTGFTPYSNGIGYLMGFTSSSYSGQSVYVSEYVLNTNGDNYVFLQLLDIEDCLESFSYGNASIKAFAKIIVDVNKNMLNYDNGSNTVSKEAKFPQPTNISTFRVRIVDAYGQTINLMADFSFTLEIQEVLSSKVYEAYRNNLIADC